MRPTIWDFARRVTWRLLGLNVLNMVCGVLLQRAAAFQRGIGVQAIGWAVVNILIAVIGGRGTERRARAAEAHSAATLRKETRTLRWLLWINAGLDVLYMLGGWQWARRNRSEAFLRGNGIGVMVQGALLFVFDVYHALRIPPVADQPPPITPITR
jgi:hypothetical protein